MIVDNLYTARCEYGNMDLRLAKAFDWLRKTDLASLKPDQKIEIDGNRVFALTQGYKTQESADLTFETHRSYADIQLVVKGSEICEWAPLANLTKVKTPYNPERDCEFFEEPDYSIAVRLEAGDFAVFYPTDGHKPRCCVGKPSDVQKIVVKVAV